MTDKKKKRKIIFYKNSIIMKEIYRWIKCDYFSNKGVVEVTLRQSEPFSEVFLDEDGNEYNIKDLNFTQIPSVENVAMDNFAKSQEYMQRMNEEHERTQNQLHEMLASMDAKAIADHQAVIDERAYWRKLRGEIFMKILERGGEFTRNSELSWAVEQTDIVFNGLYEQYKKFETEKRDTL